MMKSAYLRHALTATTEALGCLGDFVPFAKVGMLLLPVSLVQLHCSMKVAEFVYVLVIVA